MTRFAFALAVLCASALPAWGQEQCYEYRTVVENLAKLHGEHLIGAGLADDEKSTLRIFASPHGETWTALEVSYLPDGTKWAFVVRHGTNWLHKPLPLGPVS